MPNTEKDKIKAKKKIQTNQKYDAIFKNYTKI